GENSLEPREPDDVADRVCFGVEEADDVRAPRLLVDQEQRLLAGLGIELVEPQRGSSKRKRVELVDERPVDLTRERPGVLGVDFVELAPQRRSTARQRERGGEQERETGSRREQERQLDRKSHRALVKRLAACGAGSKAMVPRPLSAQNSRMYEPVGGERKRVVELLRRAAALREVGSAAPLSTQDSQRLLEQHAHPRSL